MTPPDGRATVLVAPRPWAKALPALGVALIWAFLIVFLVYPLLRLFYDAFTDDAGRFTLLNFYEFFTDRFYLRSLWNSILLGAGRRHRLSARSVRLLGAERLLLPDADPDHLAASGGGARVHLHHGAGGHHQRLPDGLPGHAHAYQLRLRDPRRAPGGDPAPVSDDHPKRRGRARQGGPLAGGGGGKRRRPGLAEDLDHHPAADDPRVHGRGTPGLHLDVRRLRDPVDPWRPRPAGLSGLPERRPVRGPAPLQDGDRDLSAHGDPGRALPDRRQAVCGHQGLLLARLFQGGAAAPVPREADPGRGSALVRDAPLLHPLHRGDAGGLRQGMVADSDPPPVHAPVLRAGHRRDAEVHPEQLPVLGHRCGTLHPGRGADRVDARANPVAGEW